jgi:hypothetical protein
MLALHQWREVASLCLPLLCPPLLVKVVQHAAWHAQLYAELMYTTTVGGQSLQDATHGIAKRLNIDLGAVMGPGFDDIRVVHRQGAVF